MANLFLEALDEYRRRDQPAPAPQPSAPLPTEYSIERVPQGTLRDADTLVRPTGEAFRGHGIDAPELKDRKTGELIPAGQEAYARSATLFRQNPDTTPVRYGNDYYGRTVADEVTPDGRSVYGELVRSGDARQVNYNRAPTLPHNAEANARFDETNPPSDAAKALAAFRGGPVSRADATPVRLDPKYRTSGEELATAWQRGGESAKSGAYGMLSAVGAALAGTVEGKDPREIKDESKLSLRDRITNWMQRTGEAGYMEHEAKSRELKAPGTFQDVLDRKLDLWSWGLSALGEAAPSTLAMAASAAATGGIGALAGRAAAGGALGAALKQSAAKAAEAATTTAIRRKLIEGGVAPLMAQSVARSVAVDPVKHAMRTYGARAAFAGAWGGSATPEGGHIYEETKQTLGQQNTDPWQSIGAGLAAGFLDTAAVAYLAAPFAKAFSTPAAQAALAPVAGKTMAEKLGGLVTAVAGGALKGVPTEGVTESIQEIIAVASLESQRQSDVPLADRLIAPEYLHRYMESGLSGALFGGVFSGVGGGFSHAMKPSVSKNKEPLSSVPQESGDAPLRDPHDALGGADAVPVGDELQGRVDVPVGGADVVSDRGGARAAPGVEVGVSPEITGDSVLGGADLSLDPSRAVPLADQAQGAVQVPGPGLVLGDVGTDLSGLEVPVDRVTADAQLFGDLGTAKAIREQGFGSLGVDSQLAVLDRMRAALHDDEVARVVLASLPVDVMHDFGLKERTPENFLHNKSVLSDALSVSTSDPVTVFQRRIVDEIAARAPRDVALPGAETVGASGDVTGRPVESDATIGVGADASRHSSGPLNQDAKGVGDAVPPASPAPTVPQPTIQLQRGQSIVLNESGAPAPYQRRQPPPPSGPKSQLRIERPGAKPVAAAPSETPPVAPETKPGEVRVTRPGPDGFFTEKMLRDAPDSVFVFGDNLAGWGKGGQAKIRSESNAFGFPTKKLPRMDDGAFLEDADLDKPSDLIPGGLTLREHIRAKAAELARLRDAGKTVVFSGDGLGSGRAGLQTRPAVAKAINDALAEFGFPAMAPESTTPSASLTGVAEPSARAPRVESHSNGPAPTGPDTARARGPAPSAEPRNTPAPVASKEVSRASPSPPKVGSSSVPPGSDARKGIAFAKQLSTAWGNLLGIAPIEPALTEAQARSLVDSTDPRARYDAALDVARSTAKQFVFERWASAGEKIKKQIQKAYASRKSEVPFDAWLGEQVSQSLLHDEAVRRIYADANLPAVYRWLRDVGRSLLRLVNAFTKQFGYEVKEPNAAVAEWVRNAIDQERTRFAEQQGVSPETTRLLKEATNALLSDANATALLDRIEQRLVEDQTGSLYHNWLTALRAAQKAATTAQIADELAPIKVRERMSAVLRDGLTKIDPWYALESFPSRKARREFLRQRASDYLSGLPALEKASPEAAEAARTVLKLAMQAEEALAVAGSFSQAVDHLPVRETKRVRGESMRDVAGQSELVQNTDRARAVLKDKQKAPEGYMPPAGAKAALSAYWQALGFAAEDAPPLLPATESLDDAILGAHVAPYDDPVIGTRTALAEYVVASRALEGLPAAYRDSLVGAWRESGESDFADFLVNETDKVLASDATPYHVLYQATRDSADSAEQGKQLQIKRRTLNHLLGLALASEETPNPAVRDALRYRMRARYGSEALADADRLLGGVGVRNPWFLLGQGYSKTADGSPAFDAARRLKGQRVLRDAHRLLASVPGLSDATSAERAAFLRDNLPALAEFDASFKALAPDRDAGGALVDWFDSLDKAMGQTDEQTVEAAMDEETVEDTDEEWEARAMADGANLADQEMFQEIEEANERKTTLTNTIALVSQYDPARGKLAPRLIRAFRSLPESTDGGTLLNSDETTDFAHTAPLDTPFEADFDHKVFRELPTALQHFLLQRGQLLGRMGVVSPEYRIKQHITRNGRKVSYLEESMTLSDRATLYGGRLKDGAPIAERLAIDRAKDLLDDAARRTSRFSAATKYGSVPGGNFAALKFDVKAAIDHPLIGAIVEAFERDPGVREKISEVRAGWADGNRAALLAELDGLLPTVIEAFDLDPTLKSLSDSGSLVPLLVAAMGHDQDVFYGGGNPSTKASLNAPDLRPHERASIPRVEVRIDPAYAQELGLRAKPNAYGKPGDVYYSIAFARDERAALSAFLRMYATNFDASSGTIKTGATREVNGDALVGLGMRSLNGLDAAPSVNFSRVDSLYKGLDIAGQLASPWVPADPFWRSWSGISSAKTANDPHMGLIVRYDAKRDPNDQWTLGDEVSSRAAQQIIQGDSASSSTKTPLSEKSLYDLDLAVQDAAARLDELRVRYDLSKGASLGEQALAEDGSPLWTYEGVLPPNVLWRAMFGDNTAELQLYKTRLAAWRNQQATKQGEKKLPKPEAPNLVEAKPWLRRFRGGKAAPSFVFEGQKYEARPFLGIDELQHTQAYRSKIRARIAELRSEMQEQYLGDRRMMGGSELNYAPNFEEEMSDIDSWLDDMGLGNNAARVNPEAALFNPDLNNPKVQWDADFKGHGYEGLRGLEAPGEQKGKGDATPQAKDLPPVHDKPAQKEERYRDPSAIAALPEPRLPLDPPAPDFKVKPISLPEPQSPTIDRLTRFAADAARTMGLDPKGFKLTLINSSALLADKERTAEEAFRAAMAAIGHAELAEQAWRQAADEPVFVLFDDGVPHIVAFDADLTSGAKLSEAFLRRAVAHELGHVYFDRHLKAELARRGARTRLVNQLKGVFPGKTIETDLEIEEAVAEALADSIVGKAPAKQTVLGKVVDAVKSAWARFFGEKREDLSFMAAHNEKRVHEKSAQGDGIRYYSGRKLLEDTKAAGAGTWATMKDLYSTVVRTAHSWLRSQLDAKGAPIDAFKVMADILRWTPGVAPQTRSFGGQLFDFTSTDGDYRISYEQATTRHFARFGHRVETMFNSWNPANEKASIWDAKKRAEIAETQRQRQVQAVQDYVNGVKTKHSVELGQLFDALGDYFGPVLKRHDPSKALPRIFDQTALRERKDDFLALLERASVEAEEAEQIWSRLAKEAGSDYRNDANVFFAPHFQRARMGDALDAISDRDLLPFLLIDSQPQAALWQYVHQAVKRTEFERRFGGWVYFDKAVDFSPEANVKPRLLSPADEEKMREARPIDAGPGKPPKYELPNGKSVIWDHTAKWRMLRAEAAAQGATPGQLNRFLKITEAELGRLGADFSPRLRTLQSALVAGMNWAVLPLSLTSQVTDLALPLLRSNGDFASAWKGMKTALRELRKNGDLYAAAKANGILAGNLRNYFASSYLDAPYMDSWAMKWNERLFKLNGMEKATEFVRLYAFATGAEWIKSLAAKDTTEANAQLAQLGLDRADVLAWQAQQEKLDTGEGAPDEASERVQQALDTFVEQSMFRPSASQRPTWASHPAAMLVWYLKSYIWAYADTVLSRTWREFQRRDGYGQKALVLAMPALFMLPLAVLGLALRDELRDDLDGLVLWRMPKREREETATDEIARLIGRTGLLGPMQTLIDAGRASEYGSPYYLALIGPFATMTDQALKRIGSAGEGKVTKSVAESLMQLTPVLGSLPQERRALANWAF